MAIYFFPLILPKHLVWFGFFSRREIRPFPKLDTPKQFIFDTINWNGHGTTDKIIDIALEMDRAVYLF